MKYIIPLLLSLTAALGGCSSSSDSALPTTDLAAQSTPTVPIDESNSLVEVDEAGLYDLDVSGSGNYVKIEDGDTIGVLTVSGSNNLIAIDDSVTISSIEATGSNNTVIAALGSKYTFNNTDGSNQYSEQSIETQSIAGTATLSLNTINVDQSVLYDLEVSGSGFMVNIANDNTIGALTVSGSNNQVTIGTNVTIKIIEASGTDNTVIAPAGSNYTFSDTSGSNDYIE